MNKKKKMNKMYVEYVKNNDKEYNKTISVIFFNSYRDTQINYYVYFELGKNYNINVNFFLFKNRELIRIDPFKNKPVSKGTKISLNDLYPDEKNIKIQNDIRNVLWNSDIIFFVISLESLMDRIYLLETGNNLKTANSKSKLVTLLYMTPREDDPNESIFLEVLNEIYDSSILYYPEKNEIVSKRKITKVLYTVLDVMIRTVLFSKYNLYGERILINTLRMGGLSVIDVFEKKNIRDAYKKTLEKFNQYMLKDYYDYILKLPKVVLYITCIDLDNPKKTKKEVRNIRNQIGKNTKFIWNTFNQTKKLNIRIMMIFIPLKLLSISD